MDLSANGWHLARTFAAGFSRAMAGAVLPKLGIPRSWVKRVAPVVILR